ncbi:HesA/MoeB/ThiF family protein [Desulforhopalus singaporensis]|uniref:Molybdopterin or thiamine biosynthesis adenylyltransferase n=1 Tax=Desulforhopalus singaporensis TaxID=91360 RepID=A0A1H0LA17_9BACT|nr:ThiF family adenylyltransferase [Desulforhopalus singaporensis]SDO64906.1 Molybdopterin or thiamine biosynthesis adenylyltransferase [Desulforhopalus singaporensis]
MKSNQTLKLLNEKATQRTRPDQSRYTAISLEDARHIAAATEQSLFRVEQIGLEDSILPERYSRNQKALSCKQQLQLHMSKIAIIGLGGLGGAVTEILARIGVGNITLVDGDCFDESNLNRQLLSSSEFLGIAKAKVAAQRVKAINPAVRVTSHETFFTAKNGGELLGDSQLAIDCLDTIRDRFILEECCRELSIPMVSAAIGGTCGQATVVFPTDQGLQAIYGKKEDAPSRGIEASLGTLPFAAVYMAAVECAETVSLLLDKKSQLRNSLLVTDIKDHTAEIFHFPPPAGSST